MWIANLFRLLRAYRRYRASVRVLARLDDRTLRDIGLHRSEIDGVAWEVANR